MVVTGITIGVTALGVIGYYLRNKKIKEAREKCQKELKKLRKLKERLIEVRDYCNRVKKNTGKEEGSIGDALSKSRNKFKDGGHVLDGTPLGDDKFSICFEKLDGFNATITSCYEDLKKSIETINDQIEEIEEMIDDLE